LPSWKHQNWLDGVVGCKTTLSHQQQHSLQCLYRWFDTQEHVLRVRTFQSQANYWQTRGPGATSLTWVILINIPHINTCKITFPYCGPYYSQTMTLITWFCNRLPCR
jgi:hypothetical protein